METVTYDALVTSNLFPDFVQAITQLWPLFPAGILLGVVAWLISIVVYVVLQMLNKM